MLSLKGKIAVWFRRTLFCFVSFPEPGISLNSLGISSNYGMENSYLLHTLVGLTKNFHICTSKLCKILFGQCIPGNQLLPEQCC